MIAVLLFVRGKVHDLRVLGWTAQRYAGGYLRLNEEFARNQVGPKDCGILLHA
jgi:hypothetical protein